MSEFRVAVAYAKSLITLAEEKNQLEQVYKDIVWIDKVFTVSKDLSRILKNPVIHTGKKAEILKSIFSDKLSEITNGFYILLLKKGREAFLPAIAKAFIDMYKKQSGIKVVELVTAIPLDEPLKSEIISLFPELRESKLEINTKVDNKILGGFILKSGDKQINASVTNRLKKLKQQFSQNPYIPKY